MNKKTTGMIIAAAVGALFTTASIADVISSNVQLVTNTAVKCMGINSCKGMSACKTASNSCKGMNSCKGQGFLMVKSAKACAKKGGTVASDS